VYSEIASNRRRSAVAISCFVILWLGIGAVLGLLFRELTRPSTNGSATALPANSSWAPVLIGVVVGALFAGAAILFSLTAGARTVLRTSGAQLADAAKYQQLNDLVGSLAIGEGIPTPTVYVIEDPSPNAFATGVNPDKAAITFTSGLLAIMNREELEGVISHEMSHIKNHDIRLLLVVGTLIGLAAFLASILWGIAFWSSFGDDDSNGGIGIVLGLAAAAALLTVLGFFFGPLIRLALSRRRESLADASGVELTRNPVGLLDALKKLQANDKPFKNMNHATASMCIDDPLRHHESWYHRLYDTHPPIEARIAALEKLAVGQTV
jgi:heat shock protein HtpX